MPVVGRADEDDVDVVAGEKILVRGIDIDAVRRRAAVLVLAIGSLDAVADFLRFAAMDVARGEDAAVVAAGERADVTRANQTVADDADGHLGATDERFHQHRAAVVAVTDQRAGTIKPRCRQLDLFPLHQSHPRRVAVDP